MRHDTHCHIRKPLIFTLLLTAFLTGCADRLPPKIIAASPSNELPADTKSTTISVTTHEIATCRYATVSQQDFAEMPGEMLADDKFHTDQMSLSSDESEYTFYVRCQDDSGNTNQQDFEISFSVLSAQEQGTPWAYTGIPETDWAYNPFTIQLEQPTQWPSQAAPNVYFVEPSHPNASDLSDGTEAIGEFGRFGYPNRPRATIPSNGWIGDVYPAGTVIWLKGGNYTRETFHSVWSPQFHGEEDQPVWLYGDPSDKPVFSGPRFQFFNSSHLIVDNIQWIGGNTANNVLSLTRDREGPTHHITLRNLRFENLNYIGGGGAIVGISSNSRAGAEVHNIVAYKNTFKNNGGGFDWEEADHDHHGFKVNGILNGNGVRRVWIIENRAIKGDDPDPIDERFKSLSGNLVQVGDQIRSSGNNHHIFVAGNYHEFGRQALGWTKKSHDVIFSGNYCTDVYALAGGNGQCYGHQYDLGDHNWWVNNVGTRSSTGWIHSGGNSMSGPLFIIGNQFYNNRDREANDNWRLCSGITLFNQQGTHYIVNNLFDNNCHGIWAQTNRSDSDDELHIYNNIFSNLNSNIDTSSRAISVDTSTGIDIFVENNLFDYYSDSVSIGRDTLTTIETLNATDWAFENRLGQPNYVNSLTADYRPQSDSDSVDRGALFYHSQATNVYDLFIERYENDPDFPGNPADVWPRDSGGNVRVNGPAIDIGPFELK